MAGGTVTKAQGQNSSSFMGKVVVVVVPEKIK
jgi:hypothetical protein